jgi:nucleotide-binding universal stress UspA family protein
MLFTIKRILACTDLSPRSDEVLRDAEILRQRVGAELDILYVSNLGVHLDFSAVRTKEETYYEAFLEGIASDLNDKLMDQIKRTGVKGQAIFGEGDVVEEINNVIMNGKEKYDLLMIGHHSKSGIVQELLGSVARKIVANAPIPTLVVKKKLEFDTMAAFVDGSRPVDWMVSSSLDYYRTFGFKKIEFISLWLDLPEPFHREEEARDFSDNLLEEVKYFARDNEHFEVKVEPSRDLMVAYHLIRIIEDDKIDLAIMKRNRGKNLFKKMIGSETQRILDLESTNILIMPV